MLSHIASVFVILCRIPTPICEIVNVHNLPAVLTLSDAGHQHGRHASKQIQEFFRTQEISKLLAFTRSNRGRPILNALRARASQATPWLARELAGIADGAGVALDDIWAVNLISELEYAENSVEGHCSDILAREPLSGAVWHGHTEDWSADFRPLMYFVIYNSLPRSDFLPVGGLVYPGQAPGFAVTFTPHVWTTSNSLFPIGLNQTGVCLMSTARTALQAADAQEVARLYTRAGQAYGMNTQIVAQTRGRAYAADVEVAGLAGQSHVQALDQNMTHFNSYKYLNVSAKSSLSSKHRQMAADQFAAPRSREDVLSILGDTGDPELPIYNNRTMFAVLFHSESGRFSVWHGKNPKFNAPDWESSLMEVFHASASALELYII